ncbi:MAG TPA: hypothetical protein VJ743_20220 [Albitalea sp.]|nr:hypothetical protein [Albitalea sp.]
MDDPETSRRLQLNVAFGWLAMALSLVMMSVSLLVKAAIETDFSEFVHHPGPQGWSLMCVQFFAYVMLALGCLQLDQRWFRWANAGLLAAATLVMLLHQLGHMHEGVRYGWSGAVDATHHLAGLVTMLQALRWARAGEGHALAHGVGEARAAR